MAEPNSPRSALTQRNFRFFWAGQALSLTGDRMAGIALALYITLELHDPTGLGLILGAQVAGLAAFLLFGGVWADRFDRRRLIIATDLVCFVLHGVTAYLIATHQATILNLLVIELLFGIGEAIYRPAFSGLLPQTVDEKQIKSAWSFASASEMAAIAVGPALATGLFFGIGASWAFAVDSLTFVASAVSLYFVVPRARGKVADLGESMLRSIRIGWREVVARRWVYVTIAAWSLMLMLSLAPWFVLAPLVAKDLYGSGAIYGFHEAFFGLGAVVGALAAGRIAPARPLRTALLLMTPWPAQFILFGLGAPVPLLYGSAAVAGVGMGVYGVLWESCLARWIPADLLSRVSSWDWLGSTVLMPLGFVLAGPVAALVPARDVIIAAGVIGGICIAVAAIPKETRNLGAGPAPAED